MKTFIILLSIIACSLSGYAKGGNDSSAGNSYSNLTTYYDSTTSENNSMSYSTKVPFDYKKTDEWHKYKVLRACGWSALGLGISTTLFGGVFGAYADSMNGEGRAPGVPFIVTGGVFTLASVPLLISAYHYRHKAKNLGIGVSAIATPGYQSCMSYSPAFSISFSF